METVLENARTNNCALKQRVSTTTNQRGTKAKEAKYSDRKSHKQPRIGPSPMSRENSEKEKGEKFNGIGGKFFFRGNGNSQRERGGEKVWRAK